mgnify:CR=1 FL=1
MTGPPKVFEGRFGLFASHLQDQGLAKRFGRITDGLGTDWESRNASFKPFPTAHVLHPYVSALLRLRAADPRRRGLRAGAGRARSCPSA